MATGRRHLHRGPRRDLTDDVGQVVTVVLLRGSGAVHAGGGARARHAQAASSGSGRPGSSSTSSGTGSSARTAISCRRVRTPSTETPGTSEASAAAHSGTTTCS